jgi:hypothetical protein
VQENFLKTPLVPVEAIVKGSIFNKIAAVVSLIGGLMIIVTCGQVVLLGKVPEQYVVEWMPPFQFFIGVLSVFITTILLWKDHLLAIPAVIFTLVLQGLAMAMLITAYGDSVTAKTLNTVSVRILITVAVLVLMILHRRKTRRLRRM